MPKYVKGETESALQIGDDLVIVHDVSKGIVSVKRYNYLTGQWEDYMVINQLLLQIIAFPTFADDIELNFGSDFDYSIKYDNADDSIVITDKVNGAKVLEIGRNGLILNIGNLNDDLKLTFGKDKDYSLRYDSANDRWVLRDEINGADIFAIGRNGAIQIIKNIVDDLALGFGTDNDFGIRYDSTNNDFRIKDNVNGTEYIFPKNINRNIGKIGNKGDSGDKALTIGVNGSPTRTVLRSLASDERDMLPMSVYMDIGGTVGTSETVTISVKVIFDDGSEVEVASLSKTGATGSSVVGMETIMVNLMNNVRAGALNIEGKRIKEIVADAVTNLSSTSATATARAFAHVS